MTVMSQKRPSETYENENCKVLKTSPDNIKLHEFSTNFDESGTSTSKHYPTIDYLRSDKQFVVARFIFECGSKLEAKVLTVSTAVKLFHQFNKNTQSLEYDPYLISAACLYLAGKIEDNDHLRLRDIINVVYTTLHRDREPLDLNSEYYAMRTAIVQAELLLLRILEFKTNFDHPHKYILHYLKSLKDWVSPDVWDKYPIAKTSWSLIQDAYHDSNIVMNTDNELLSVACIHLALQTYGIKVPFMSDTSNDEKAWYKVFCSTATKDKLWFVMKQLMDLYNKESNYIKPIMQKIVPNSCATHALISILLNIPEDENRLKLGSTLGQFKQHVDGMDPEMKGLAIGNSPELAQAHNSHAVPRARRRQDSSGRNSGVMGIQGAVQTSAIRQSAASQQGVNTETFHFVSYVPINGHLFELDGLKRYPIDHGPIPAGTDWTETFRKVIKERLGMATSDIRFALMALTPDPRNATIERLNMLRMNRTIVIHALKQMVSNSHGYSTNQVDSKGQSEGKINTNTALINNVSENVKCETNDMDVDDEDLKSTDVIKELEKDVQQALAKVPVNGPDVTNSNKSYDSVPNLTDSSTPFKGTNFSGLATPPKPRRATSSRTNSLESNGTGVAPGSPFQNNPLLVSHDYSKSPMLIDQDNEEAQGDTGSNEDEIESLNEVTKHDGVISGKDEMANNCESKETATTKDANSNTEGSFISDGTFAKVNECSVESTSSNSNLFRKNILNRETNDTPPFDPKLSRLSSPQRFSPSSLLSLLRNIEVDISDCRSILKEANERRRRHAIDDCRRSHDYDQFITAFLSMLAERGHLGDLLEHGISVAKKKYQSTNGANNMSGNSAGGSEGSSDSESITKSKKLKAKKALMKKKSKAKGIIGSSVSDKQKSKGRGRPKKSK